MCCLLKLSILQGCRRHSCNWGLGWCLSVLCCLDPQLSVDGSSLEGVGDLMEVVEAWTNSTKLW